MNVSTRILVACLYALLAQGVLAQGTQAPKAPAKKASPWARHALLMGPPVSCAAGASRCDVPVTMSQGSVSGVSVCLARVADEIKVPGGDSGRPMDIVWSLDRPTLPGVELFFQAKHGILVVDNLNGQLRVVGHGSSPTQFIVKNLRNRKGDSIYLPVILQRDTATGVVSLCAASDPKVVND
jgi:hypothetical protein